MPPAPSHAPSGFFVIRTPLLPLAEWLDWSRGHSAASVVAGGPQALADALTQDKRQLRERLRELVSRPFVREALFVASPSLEDSLEAWLSAPESERGRKVERTLVRYFARMAGRATPFGLFSGCATGVVGITTQLLLEGRSSYRRHTRLDMGYLGTLVESLARAPFIQAELTCRPSTSLFRAAGRFRYIQVLMSSGEPLHHLVVAEPSEHLNKTLALAREGARPAELAAALVADNVSQEVAEDFIRELLSKQILQMELGLEVTGPDPLQSVITRLQQTQGGGRRIAAVLQEAQGLLEQVDAAGLGQPLSRYQDVARLLGKLAAPVNLERLFQVDMVKHAPQAQLGQQVVAELWRGVELLHRVGWRRGDELERFRRAFTERYETREVPLLEALDEETGLPYGNEAESADVQPLLEGLDFPTEPEGESRGAAAVTGVLLHLVEQALSTGALEVELTDAQVETLAQARPPPPPLPDALAVMASVWGSAEQVNRGDFQVYLPGVGGPSGARLLGRFCHADPQLLHHVREHLRAEQGLHPEALFAEVVHLPGGRIGNVLCRPVLREYEIPFLGDSGAPPEKQLALEDLRLSVRGGRLLLRSERLDREVVPRLTSAHNFVQRNLAVYRFLGALQSQGVASSLRWDWGVVEGAPFLPRVRRGRLVLSLARWRLEEPELATLARAEGAALYEAVQALRTRRRLPRWVCLVDRDNVLSLDLENILCLEVLAKAVKGRAHAELTEQPSRPEALPARGPEGAFVHELIVPFVRRAEAAAPPRPKLPARPRGEQQRIFLPGSEWLYAKLYTGTASADLLLREHLAPLVERVMASGAAKRWFFLRYADPGWHLRLRFQGEPRRLQAEVLPQLEAVLEPLRAEGLLSRMVVDTYEREVERYGGHEGMALAEQLFHHDSEAALSLVRAWVGDESGEARWRLALWGADRLLADIGLGLEARLRMARSMRASLAREYRVDAKMETQLSARFRPLRGELEALMWGTDEHHPLAPGMEVLRQRSERWALVLAELKALQQQGGLLGNLEDIATSYVHMSINRVLRVAQRRQELVLYDMLCRLYDSRRALTRSAS